MKLEINRGVRSIETAKQIEAKDLYAEKKGLIDKDTLTDPDKTENRKDRSIEEASGEKGAFDILDRKETPAGEKAPFIKEVIKKSEAGVKPGQNTEKRPPSLLTKKELKDAETRKLTGIDIKDELIDKGAEYISAKSEEGGILTESTAGTASKAYLNAKRRRIGDRRKAIKNEAKAEVAENRLISIREEPSSFDKKKQRREKKLGKKYEKKETAARRYAGRSGRRITSGDIGKAALTTAACDMQDSSSDETVKKRIGQAKKAAAMPQMIRNSADTAKRLTLLVKRIIIGVKAAIAAFLPILIPILVVVVIVTLISSLLMIFDDDEDEQSILIPIEINGTYDGEKGELVLRGEGIEIKKIMVKGDSKGFSGKNKVKKNDENDPNESRNLPLPEGAKLKNGISWMPRMVQSNYTKQLWTGYPGYRLANDQIAGKKLVRDNNGYARVNTANGDHVIALGTAYIFTENKDDSVGKARYRATFVRNGKAKVLTATLGDIKSDSDTDSSNRYHVSDGSVVELWSWDRSSSLVNPNSIFPGTLTKLELLNAGEEQAKISADIKESSTGKYKVVIKGSVDGTEIYTEGTWEDNRVETKGFYGEGASLGVAGGEGIEDMVRWAEKIAKGTNEHGYSQASRTCWMCKKGTPDYDCSSFVTAALAHNGMGKDFEKACRDWPYTTSNIGPALKNNGWKNLGNLDPGSCKRGDIVLDPNGHVEISIGNKATVGAHQDYDGKSGESSDNEISIVKNKPHFWFQVWRHLGK